VIQFVDQDFLEMRLFFIVPISNSALTWGSLTMAYTSSVICSVPRGVTQLKEMLMMELSSSYSVLNALLDVPLLKYLALEWFPLPD
jgi:hypothetical protein